MARRLPIAFLFVLCQAQAATEATVRQVLASKCWSCHGQTALGGLRLDSREGMIRGGKSGAAIVPGNASKSRVYQAVLRATVDGVKPMPPSGPLQSDELQTIERWINEGAPWTDGEDHWSFRPLRDTKPGETVDAFITEELKKQRLMPAPPADKRTLIRRVYFDLIGLPPDDMEFAEAFNDKSVNWLSRLTSKLLNSPHFGEKWGRHWLDVARYGEDDFSGTEVKPYANAWRYRDWVAQAWNQDLPYDRFLMAQLAGDLMNDASLLPATGLLGLGPWYYGIAQPAQSRADERHDRVDMVTRGMLGVTVACARCHDHKYDPFTAKDYYALSGVFASTAYKEYPLVSEAEAEAWKQQKKEVDEAEKEITNFLSKQSARIGEGLASQISDYMIATIAPESAGTVNPKVLSRWKTYLEKPDDSYPFLNRWFQGERTKEESQRFQKVLLEIIAEKKVIDEENRRLIEAGNKAEPMVVRTIVLPGGYRSEEDFNPGAYIPSKSLERDKFIAYKRIFEEPSSPLKFDRELTVGLLGEEERAEYERMRTKADARKKLLPPQYPFLHGAGEFQPWDLNLNIRGNPESLGEVVPRRFPVVLSGNNAILFNQGSGRLQLAETVAHHPLAARVAVNRVWAALFGQGLVRTPSNFGRVGDRPALPDLLEFLAARVVSQNYSMKALLREIVLSEAYQRSSAGNLANEKLDPENRYMWRQSRRRLDAEPLRDAMLAASGELDRSIGGESKPLDAAFRRRTLYAKTSRFQQDETLSLFDLPAASVTCEQRVITNVPLQKLFFLNSEMVRERGEALGKRIEKADLNDGVEAAYRLLFFRSPTQRERQLGIDFLKAGATGRWGQYAKVLLSSNEFAYVD